MASIHAVRVHFGLSSEKEAHWEDVAPFSSVPLIEGQYVSWGERSRLSCLMSYVVCCIKLWGDSGLRGTSSTPSDHCVTGDIWESGLLTVSLRHRSSPDTQERERSGRFVGLKWRLHTRNLIRRTHTISQDKDLTLGGVKKGEVSSSREKSIRNRSFWRDMCVTVNRS